MTKHAWINIICWAVGFFGALWASAGFAFFVLDFAAQALVLIFGSIIMGSYIVFTPAVRERMAAIISFRWISAVVMVSIIAILCAHSLGVLGAAADWLMIVLLFSMLGATILGLLRPVAPGR